MKTAAAPDTLNLMLAALRRQVDALANELDDVESEGREVRVESSAVSDLIAILMPQILRLAAYAPEEAAPVKAAVVLRLIPGGRSTIAARRNAEVAHV